MAEKEAKISCKNNQMLPIAGREREGGTEEGGGGGKRGGEAAAITGAGETDE